MKARSYIILIVAFLLLIYPILWLVNLAYDLIVDWRSYTQSTEMILRVRHLGMIMDGNRRWAKEHSLDNSKGYYKGLEKFWEMVELCIEEKVDHFSVFALSADNVKQRKSSDIDAIFGLLKTFSSSDKEEWLQKHSIKLSFYGSLHLLPDKVQDVIKDISIKTEHGTSLHVHILIAYDPYDDIVSGYKTIHKKIEKGELDIENISKAELLNSVCTYDVPPLDLTVRTGARERISGFLPLQSVYSEIVFMPYMWPDIKKSHIRKLINNFYVRTRTFGA